MTDDRPAGRQVVVIGELIREVLRRQGLTAKIEEHRVWQVWDAVVGPQIAARARPLRIRDGVLEVRVEEAVWMQQLQLMKLQILDRLNGRLGKPVIRDLFWRRGRVETAAWAPAKQERPWLREILDAQERGRIENVLSPLTDGELRNHLRAVFQRQTQLDKNRRKKD